MSLQESRREVVELLCCMAAVDLGRHSGQDILLVVVVFDWWSAETAVASLGSVVAGLQLRTRGV
jgi:hypothetical protein